MNIHPFPITTRTERHAARGPAAPVYVHPTVSWDMRRAEQLEQRTGRQVVINDHGAPVLAERPMVIRFAVRVPAQPVSY